ncbi:H/ACA ribonucleoprotein complex non-core subunit NAF1 isoform X2 [Rhinoderma darwinii]|uniref:H/ACA ribonucleoprotein complex non-core subunit NAF1 isoform X2 n=1 Tax=Rhinoderma darwinii TaxID=43563 RepID=UPI003F66A7C9
METQEEMALPEATTDILQNNNLPAGEDEKTSITETNTCDKTPLPTSTDIPNLSGETQAVSREGISSNDDVQILSSAPEVSEENIPTVVIESLPCNLQPQEDMEVAVQLEGLHFKNHTIGEHDGGADCLRADDCPLDCVKIQSESAYEDGQSSSEESSSDSDSDSSSSSSTSSSSSSLSSILQLDEEPLENNDVPLKTKDELLMDELPAVEELSISLPDHVELKQFGSVSSIIEQLVIIETLRDLPTILPLNEESIVFKEDRTVVGKIFEIFGPVPHPFYVVRFNSKDHIESNGIKMKDTMYFAPSVKDFTQYIIPDALKRDRGSDASWTNDQEPPPDLSTVMMSGNEKQNRRKKHKTLEKRSKNVIKINNQQVPRYQINSLVLRCFQDLMQEMVLHHAFLEDKVHFHKKMHMDINTDHITLQAFQNTK